MISDEVGAHHDARDGRAVTCASWRRGLDVLDDYSGGGVLSEELADDLVNELSGLVGARPRRSRRGPHTGSRPGPQPSRPVATPPSHRPRLTLVRD